MTGYSLTTFDCSGFPILHYDEDSDNADIAIMETGVTNQIIAVQIEGDNINTKELWYGEGNIDYGFIVKDYFVTAWQGDVVYFKIYEINTGQVVWKTQFNNSSSSATLSVFGGLIPGKKNDELMIMIRVGQTIYAYKEMD